MKNACTRSFTTSAPGKPIWDDYLDLIEGARTRRAQVRLPRANAPTGRARRDDEYVEITWTIAAPEDASIEGKTARRHHRLRRLLAEAFGKMAGWFPRAETPARH